MKQLNAIKDRIQELLAEVESLENAISRDPLTGLYRREVFLDRLQLLTQTRPDVCLMVLDIDFFKRINDSLGHAGGDEVLKAVAAKLLQNEGILAGRFGGEEFLVATAGALPFAQRFAEKLRTSISELTGALHCTVSIGVAQMKGGESLDELFARADKALYVAKHEGRNQTQIAA